MGQVILKRASASRSLGLWRDNDYDVLEDGFAISRIFKAIGPERASLIGRLGLGPVVQPFRLFG